MKQSKAVEKGWKHYTKEDGIKHLIEVLNEKDTQISELRKDKMIDAGVIVTLQKGNKELKERNIKLGKLADKFEDKYMDLKQKANKK